MCYQPGLGRCVQGCNTIAPLHLSETTNLQPPPAPFHARVPRSSCLVFDVHIEKCRGGVGAGFLRS